MKEERRGGNYILSEFDEELGEEKAGTCVRIPISQIHSFLATIFFHRLHACVSIRIYTSRNRRRFFLLLPLLFICLLSPAPRLRRLRRGEEGTMKESVIEEGESGEREGGREGGRNHHFEAPKIEPPRRAALSGDRGLLFGRAKWHFSKSDQHRL